MLKSHPTPYPAHLSPPAVQAEPGDMLKNQVKVFAEAEATAAKYQERLEAERKAREEAAQARARLIVQLSSSKAQSSSSVVV